MSGNRYVNPERKKRPQETYFFTWRGTYRTLADGTPKEKTYRVANVPMSQLMVENGVFGSWLVQGPEILAKKYPDEFIPGRDSLLTWEIEKSRTGSGAPITNPRLMSSVQLVEYIAEEGFPVEVELYTDLGMLQQAVLDFQEALRKNEPEVFIKNQEGLRKRVGGKISLRNEAIKMNADWEEIEDEDIDLDNLSDPEEPEEDEDEIEEAPKPAAKPAGSAKERAAAKAKEKAKAAAGKKTGDKDVIAGL